MFVNIDLRSLIISFINTFFITLYKEKLLILFLIFQIHVIWLDEWFIPFIFYDNWKLHIHIFQI